jgi:thiosulfate/3-mercaptopyruvate sulfurtransferase
MASILFWLGKRLRIALAVALLLPVGVVAAPGFLVSSDWLAERIDDEDLVVLEVRYHPHRYFTVGHIPGAVRRFKDLGDNQGDSFRRQTRPEDD